jgi:hypothetical protein
MPPNYTASDVGAIFHVIKTSNNEKMWMTATLTEFAESMELLPYVILNWKTMPKGTVTYGFNNHVSS